ncbi:MAG: SCO family protein [Granulosicoccus sp.]|nr:SCO family protein [Granulosicoccus sp.]
MKPFLWLSFLLILVPSIAYSGPFERLKSQPEVPAFSLQTHAGEPFTEADLLDRWTLVLVGFTSCPDVCPYTLGNLEHVLAETASKVRPDNLPEVVFLAVDPKRDQQSLAEYVGHFHPDFTGVTGDTAQIDSLVQGLEAFYAFEEPDSTGFYNVRHSADIRIIDPQGRLHATMETPMNAHETSDFLLRLQVDYRKNLQ